VQAHWPEITLERARGRGSLAEAEDEHWTCQHFIIEHWCAFVIELFRIDGIVSTLLLLHDALLKRLGSTSPAEASI
jgi:hypothetical protein